MNRCKREEIYTQRYPLVRREKPQNDQGKRSNDVCQLAINKHKMKLKLVVFMHPSPHIGETPRLHYFPFKCLQKLELYSSDMISFPKCSEF